METKKKNKDSIGKTIRKQFVAGLLVIVPLGASILILIWVFNAVDDILQPIIRAIWDREIPGVGFGVTVILIYLAGIVARNVIGYKVMQYFDRLLKRVPIFSLLYRGIKQITDSFSVVDNTNFLQVVIVDFPYKGMKAIALVTNEVTGRDGKKTLTVLIPTAPNPTTGFMQIVKEEDVIRTNISIDEAVKMCISAGRVVPGDLKNKC